MLPRQPHPTLPRLPLQWAKESLAVEDLLSGFGIVLLVAFGAGLCLARGMVGAFGGSGSILRARLSGLPDTQPASSRHPAALTVLRDRRMSRYDAFDFILGSNPLAHAIALELAQARVPLRVGEYLLLRAACAGCAGLLLMALGGSILAILPGAILGYFAPKLYVCHRRRSRLAAIDLQLVEALALTANSMRAGWGFMQAMAQVAHDMPPPIADEFTEVLQEVSLGTSHETAIQSLLRRVPSYDLELVMTAVLIQRQIGGNLAEIMDKIAFTIRERTHLIADIASITAEAKLSMGLLSVLPIGLLIFMAATQPDYMLPFMTDPRGRIMLVSAAMMEIVGVLMLRRFGDVQA